MIAQFLACEILVDRVLDMTFLEIAIRGVHVAERHRAGARTLTELPGARGFDGTELADPDAACARRVSVRVDLWIVELIEELVESQRPSRVRAFIRDAVLNYVDFMAETQHEAPDAFTRTAS